MLVDLHLVIGCHSDVVAGGCVLIVIIIVVLGVFVSVLDEFVVAIAKRRRFVETHARWWWREIVTRPQTIDDVAECRFVGRA